MKQRNLEGCRWGSPLRYFISLPPFLFVLSLTAVYPNFSCNFNVFSSSPPTLPLHLFAARSFPFSIRLQRPPTLLKNEGMCGVFVVCSRLNSTLRYENKRPHFIATGKCRCRFVHSMIIDRLQPDFTELIPKTSVREIEGVR